MRLGEFLVSRGAVRSGDIVAALELQQHEQQPLGRLALRHGLLTINDIFNILRIQADRITARDRDNVEYLFGDIAVELGFLTTEDVLNLLKIQMETRPPLGDLLVSMGVLTAEDLSRELEAYRAAVLTSSSS